MALIKCPECGNEVSENAANCPNCGNPIAQKEQRPQQPRPLPPPTPQQAPKKMCKHCKAEIPKTAKVCPNCNKKQGGVIKWVIIAVVAIVIIAAIAGGGDNNSNQSQQSSNGGNQSSQPSAEKDSSTEKPVETEKPIEYISVTADELSEALSANAMKAQNDYEEQYLEITGQLGNIDSDGKYLGIKTEGFSLTNIQCYIKTDEQKQIIMELSRGDTIVIKGYCKDIGEILGYQIDINEIIIP